MAERTPSISSDEGEDQQVMEEDDEVSERSATTASDIDYGDEPPSDDEDGEAETPPLETDGEFDEIFLQSLFEETDDGLLYYEEG